MAKKKAAAKTKSKAKSTKAKSTKSAKGKLTGKQKVAIINKAGKAAEVAAKKSVRSSLAGV